MIRDLISELTDKVVIWFNVKTKGLRYIGYLEQCTEMEAATVYPLFRMMFQVDGHLNGTFEGKILTPTVMMWNLAMAIYDVFDPSVMDPYREFEAFSRLRHAHPYEYCLLLIEMQRIMDEYPEHFMYYDL